jgi:hypothetical protein
VHAQQTARSRRIQDFVTLDTIIYLPEKPTLFIPQFLTISYFNNNITVSYPNKGTLKYKRFIQLFKINCSDYSTGKIYLDVREEKLKGIKPYFKSLAENEQNLVALSGQYVLIFKKSDNDSIYPLERFEKLPDYYESVKIFDNNLILTHCYNDGIPEANTLVRIEDINTGKVKKVFHPEFQIPEFTLFAPNHYIEQLHDKIFVAQASAYQVDVYNDRGEKINLIKRDSLKWEQLPAGMINRLRKKVSISNPREMIDSLAIYYDESASFIQQVFSRDDSTLLVVYKMPGKDKCRYIDFWLQDPKGEFHLKYDHVVDSAFISDLNYFTKANQEVQLYFKYPIIEHDKLILPQLSAGIYPVGLTGRELRIKTEDALANDSIVFGIKVFRWKKS